jgi:hypothetical protein
MVSMPPSGFFESRTAVSSESRATRRKPNLSETEAHHLVEFTDATTHRQLLKSWGIDVGTPANRWRADVVLGCPEREECTDENACIDAVTALLTSAYHVYAHYLNGHAGDALSRFTEVRRRHCAHIRHCGPALLGPVPEYSTTAWRTRMHTARRAGWAA